MKKDRDVGIFLQSITSWKPRVDLCEALRFHSDAQASLRIGLG